MLPAHQRFVGDDVAVGQAHDRLVIGHELAALQGAAQIALEFELAQRVFVQAFVEQGEGVAAGRLGAVHGHVGVAQQLFRIAIAGVGQRDADAGRGVELLAGDAHRFGQAADHPFGHHHGVARFLDAIDDDGEFVAAEARDRVRFAHATADAARGLLQQFVADQVADRIVDDLEAVEIEEEHGEIVAALAAVAVQGQAQRRQQLAAVRQAGEGVVQGFVLEPVLDALAHRDLLAQLDVRIGQFARARRHALLQVGIGLAQGLVGLAAFERVGDVEGDEAQQLLVALRVQVIGRIALHRDQADGLALAHQRHAQPADRLRAEHLHFAGFLQPGGAGAIGQQRLARAQHVFAEAAAERAAALALVAFVHRIGEFELVARFVQQRDVEIARVEQLADDLVHAGVEGVDAGAAAGDFRDPVQGALQALAALALGDFVAQFARTFFDLALQLLLRLASRQRIEDVLGDVVEQDLVVLAVTHGRVVALHHDRAAHHAVLDQRHAQPVFAVRAQAVVAGDAEFLPDQGRGAACRAAVADHRQRQAVAEFADRRVLLRIGHVGVVAVGEIDEAQGFAARIETRDIEVFGVHQPAHDEVQAVQHFVRALVGTGEVADGEQRALQALGRGQAFDIDLQALRVQQGLRAQRQRRQAFLPVGIDAIGMEAADQGGPEAGVLRQHLRALQAAVGENALGRAAFAAGAFEQAARFGRQRFVAAGMQLARVAGLMVPDQVHLVVPEFEQVHAGHAGQHRHVAGSEQGAHEAVVGAKRGGVGRKGHGPIVHQFRQAG